MAKKRVEVLKMVQTLITKMLMVTFQMGGGVILRQNTLKYAFVKVIHFPNFAVK